MLTAQMGEQVSLCPRGPVIFRETLKEADKMARVPSDPQFPHALSQPLLSRGFVVAFLLTWAEMLGN